MKRKNMPHRKNDRRKEALYRIKSRLARGHYKAPESEEKARKEMKVLQGRIV